MLILNTGYRYNNLNRAVNAIYEQVGELTAIYLKELPDFSQKHGSLDVVKKVKQTFKIIDNAVHRVYGKNTTEVLTDVRKNYIKYNIDFSGPEFIKWSVINEGRGDITVDEKIVERQELQLRYIEEYAANITAQTSLWSRSLGYIVEKLVDFSTYKEDDLRITRLIQDINTKTDRITTDMDRVYHGELTIIIYSVLVLVAFMVIAGKQTMRGSTSLIGNKKTLVGTVATVLAGVVMNDNLLRFIKDSSAGFGRKVPRRVHRKSRSSKRKLSRKRKL